MGMRRLTEAEYRAQWEFIHRRVFSNAPIQDGPFSNPSWKMVLLPGDLLLDREDFEALRTAALSFDDWEFIVVDGEGTFADEAPVVIPWDYAELERFRPRTVFGHAVAHSFGRSAQWGRASSEETFNVLGGSPDFMDRFVEAAGGLPLLRERFTESVASGDVSFGRWRDPLARRLLELVGWDGSR